MNNTFIGVVNAPIPRQEENDQSVDQSVALPSQPSERVRMYRSVSQNDIDQLFGVTGASPIRAVPTSTLAFGLFCPWVSSELAQACSVVPRCGTRPETVSSLLHTDTVQVGLRTQDQRISSHGRRGHETGRQLIFSQFFKRAAGSDHRRFS